MPKPINTALDQRVQADSRINTPGLEVSANPVSTVGTPQAAIDHQVDAFTNSLAAFTGGVQAVAQVQSAEMIQKQATKGLTSIATGYDPKVEPTYTTDQTPWYTEARINAWSQRKGVEVAADMHSEYLKLKGTEGFATADIPKWVTGQMQERLQGLTDPTAIQGVMKHVSKLQEDILNEAPREQETLRHAHLVADIQSSGQALLVNSGYASQSYGDLATQTAAAGLPMTASAETVYSAAVSGKAKGNLKSITEVYTPRAELGGKSWYEVSDLKLKERFDILNEHVTTKAVALKEKLDKATKEASTQAMHTSAIEELATPTPQGINDFYTKQLAAGFTPAEIAASVVPAIRATEALTGVSAANSLLNVPMPAIGSHTTLSVSEPGAPTNQAISALAAGVDEQKKIASDASKKASAQEEFKYDSAMKDPNKADWQNLGLSAKDLKGSLHAIQANPTLSETDKLAVKNKFTTQFYAGKDEMLADAAYQAGVFSTALLTDGDKNAAVLRGEKEILKSAPNLAAAVQQMDAKATANGVPSKFIMDNLAGLLQRPPMIKGVDGVEVFNPEVSRAMHIAEALSKVDGGARLGLYIKGPESLAIIRMLRDSNEGGASAEDAFKRTSANFSPERIEHNKAMVAAGGQEVVANVTSSLIGSKVSNKAAGQGWWYNTNISNVSDVEAAVHERMPVALVAANGNPVEAAQMLEKDLKRRLAVIRTKTHFGSDDEGDAMFLPDPVTPEISRVLQTFYDNSAAQHPNEGLMHLSVISQSRGTSEGVGSDVEFQISFGGVRRGTVKLSALVEQDKKKNSQEAYLKLLDAKGATQAEKDSFRFGNKGILTKARAQEISGATESVARMVATQEPLESALKGITGGPVLKGTGPVGNHKVALGALTESPGFAIGVAVEGIRSKAYKDNDGGITLGVGYNTKHRSDAEVAQDFKEAGIPSTPGFISSVKSGEVGLTLPQMKALHGVAFSQYQKKSAEILNGLHPGAWDTLNEHQKAAVGQLAYNTGFNSGQLKGFLTKVSQGHEEAALKEMHVVWHDNKGNKHVNTDMMRIIRAMWAGPETFKTALSFG